MSKIINYSSENILNNGIRVICNIDMPVSGEESDEIYAERLESLGVILDNQYLTSIKRVLMSYEKSSLPQKFITNQKILIKNLPTYNGLYGMFDHWYDDIIADANTISEVYHGVSSSFLFGHEMGHKLYKYKSNEELLRGIANILDISAYGNDYLITETFSDECGNLISPTICEHDILPFPLEDTKREGIQRLILEHVYK